MIPVTISCVRVRLGKGLRNIRIQAMEKERTSFKQVSGCLLGAMLMLGISQPAMSSLIENGGFETGSLTDWTSSGNVAVHQEETAVLCCIPSEGIWFAAFNRGGSTPNGIISQEFNTNIGTQYILEFDFGRAGQNGDTAALQVEILNMGGSSLVDDIVSDSNGGFPGDYSPFSYFFIALSTETTLRFTDKSIGGNSFDVLLDDVSVSAVPVPAALWLFGTALIGLLGFNKRRKAT